MRDFPESFQDLDHMKRISEHLWRWQEYGQASLMVGAGFSRLAIPKTSGTPSIPLWGDLAQRMYEELSPNKAKSSPSKGELAANSLRLAGQYEARFGRCQLDSLLRRELRDEQYDPGPLHESLLALPWSDVFTTNYDTLIERARHAIPDRKYELLQTPEDIPGSSKPRIVKLHGSFPSNRPFIITEEDFRTYPKKFAPFVNLVQQSLLENVFCLLGFSGTDPNFLSWAGWVRDNLGEAAPKLYLCGVLDLLPAQRIYLNYQNVEVVDLGSVFPEFDFGERRFALAIEWFLNYLHDTKPLEKVEWPYVEIVARRQGAVDIGSHDSFYVPYEPLVVRSRDDTFKKSDIEKLLRAWRESRIAYPGWLICPSGSRERMSGRRLETATYVVLDTILDFDLEGRLALLYELIWRYDLCLLPLPESLVQALERQLLGTAQRLGVKGALFQECSGDSSSSLVETRSWFEDTWFELALTQLRLLREEFRSQEFDLWLEGLSSVAVGDRYRESSLCYEKCMKSLYDLQILATSNLIKEWVVAPEDCKWALKKSAIAAELEQPDIAESLVLGTLDVVRASQNNREVENIELMSIEAWAMLLQHTVAASRDFTGVNQILKRLIRGRLRSLAVYLCDPTSDQVRVEENVLRRQASQKEPTTQKRGFDPGYYTVTHSLGTRPDRRGWDDAYALVRMGEVGSYPMRCGNVVSATKSYNAAARIFAERNIQMSLSLAIRNEGASGVKFLDRIVVTLLSEAEVLQLHALLTNAIGGLLGSRLAPMSGMQRMQPFLTERVLGGAMEALARLAFRLSNEQRHSLLELAISAYNHSYVRGNFRLYDPLRNLFKRILFAMDDKDLANALPEVASLEIPGFGCPPIDTHLNWPEPSDYVEFMDASKPLSGNCEKLTTTTLQLIMGALDSDEIDVRESALSRVLKLKSLGMLSEEELYQVGEKLSAFTDEKTGLPAFRRYFASVLLDFPGSSHAVRDSLKQFFLKNAFPKSGLPSSNERRITSYPTPLLLASEDFVRRLWLSTAHRWRKGTDGLDWTREEADLLLSRALEFWNTEKFDLSALKEKGLGFGFGNEGTKELFIRLGEIVFYELVPRLGRNLGDRVFEIESMYHEMEIEGLSVLRFAPIMNRIAETPSRATAAAVVEALQSAEEERVVEAALTIEMWALFASYNKFNIPRVPRNVIRELLVLLRARRQPALDVVLLRTAFIVQDTPSVFSKEDKEGLCDALDSLLGDVALPKSVQDYFDAILLERRNVSDENLLEYQVAGATLASALYEDYIRANVDGIPESLIRWKDFACDSYLPEVRKAFKLGCRTLSESRSILVD